MNKKKFILIICIVIMIATSIGAVILKFSFSEIINFLKLIINKFLILYALVVAVYVFLDNDNPNRTLSWMLVLILLPYLGIVLYVLLGKNLISKRIIIKKKISNLSIEEIVAETQLDAVEFLSGESENNVVKTYSKTIRLLLKNSNSLLNVNNEIEVLTNGVQTFSRIINCLNNAKKSIHLNYFIIKNDELGNKIKNILIKKSKEGIKVRIIYDAVGSWKLGKKYKNDLRDAKIEVYPFYPVAFPVLTRKLNYRNHRKIVIVDGETGFFGGLNIGDEYLGKGEKLGFWRDTHLKISGDGVRELQKIFISDWKFVSGEKLDIDKLYKKSITKVSSFLQITDSGPDSIWKNIHQGYFSLIANAKSKIWIETPYLVPDESLKIALKTAALSGIDVKIIIPSKLDHFFAYWASRDNIEGLLASGVKMYTYQKGFVHSKILLVDGSAASVGTANLDMRSFGINYEVNGFIYGKETVLRLEEDFKQDIMDSTEVIYETYIKRNIKIKILEALGRVSSPIQ